MLGHSSVLVTERYAHFADSAIDRAARATHRVEGSAKDHATGSGGPTPSSVAAITNHSEELLRVGRAGLEPATYGLKAADIPEELRGVNPILILRGSFIRRVLQLAARHDPEAAEEMTFAMRALASTVLATDEVRLAREVLEGGRFAAVKAVELAERLLVAEAPGTGLPMGNGA